MMNTQGAGRYLSALLIAITVLLAGCPPARAQSQAKPPVAVISLVWGVVTVKHESGDYKPAEWLEPIYADDYVKTVGPGSKLLITYFFDNHQEVLGPDSVATVGFKTLASQSGAAIRKDKARNPFGQGMDNPFVYTMKLTPDSFKGADAPGAMDQEKTWLKCRVKATYPPIFSWQPLPKVSKYSIQFFDTLNQTLNGATSTTPTYKATQKNFSLVTLGQTFLWQVTGPNGQVVVPRHRFMVLGRKQQDWLETYRKDFSAKRKAGKLERSDFTDCLLIAAQMQQVDEAVLLAQEMARENPRNSKVFRALTRAYLAKGCPAHAKQAYDQQIKLGGIDPIQ